MKLLKTFSGCVIIFVAVFTFAGKSFGADLYDYGKTWNGWSDDTRNIYLRGFKDASNHSLVEYARWNYVHNKKPEQQKDFSRFSGDVLLDFEIETLRDVITDLYRDPSNTLISFVNITYIARERLKGKSIEERLGTAKEQALRRHRIMEEIEKRQSKGK